jgi:hypothetical protein
MYISEAGIEGDTKEVWNINFPGYARVLNLLPFPDPLPSPPLYPNQIPVGEGRGIFHSIRGNLTIVVVNSVVYALSPTLGQTTIGTLNSSSGEVYMAENLNSQVCIVDGVNCWIYNYSLPAPNLTKQTSGALGDGTLVPSYVSFHGSFFHIANSPSGTNSSSWYIFKYSAATAIIQPTTNSVFTIETKPDFALAVIRIPSRANNILALGSTVGEIWTLIDGDPNYTRNQSLSINYGCQSTSTIAEGGEFLVWLGVNEDESPVICVYDGDELKNISTDGIDYLLGTIIAPQTSTAMLYRENGHLFYILTFYDSKDNLTLMYDFNTQLFFNLTDQAMNFHPARGIVYFNLKTYFISLRNAALYEISSKYTTINENLPRTSASSSYDANLEYDMQFIRVTSNVRLADSARFIANSFVITLEQGTDVNYTGVGLINYLITEDTNNPPDDDIITEFGDFIIDENSNTGVPYIPRIDLAFSKTGGISWSSYVSRNLNPLGYQQNILHWEGMGAANDICFMLRYWTRNRVIIQNALLDVVI